jgi:UDP-perosamine 4-acetyltransferase
LKEDDILDNEDKCATPVVLVGAGRHGMLLAEKVFEDPSLTLLGFIDRSQSRLPPFVQSRGGRILGDDSALLRYKEDGFFHIALGGQLSTVRQKLIEQFQRLDLKTVSLIHPSAYIAPSATIGQGVTVLVHAVVHTDAEVGAFCCINTAAVIEHNCKLGKNVFVQPNSVLGGGVTVGGNSVIGIGASVREDISIGENCLIGGGAFVCQDIPDNSIAYGVPARVIRSQ